MRRLCDSGSQDIAAADYYFDIMHGRLLVGSAAVNAHIESGGHPADLVELGSILTDESHEVPTDRYERLEVGDWGKSDYEAHGRWLLKVTRSVRPDQRLDRSLLMRASFLGIGPVYKKVTSKDNYGSLANFVRAVGEKPHYKRNEYSGLPLEFFEDYLEQVLLCKPENTSLEDALWERSRADAGPSPDTIRRVAGNIRMLLENKGYPDIPSWTIGDYIDWGVQFMLANDGKTIETPSLQTLSARRRGPSTFAIETHFGGVMSYSWQVETAYHERLKEVEKSKSLKLERLYNYIAKADENIIARVFIEAEEAEQIARAARIWVADKLLPDISNTHRAKLAMTKEPAAFVSLIRQLSPTTTEGDIQEAALILGCYEDIWPMRDNGAVLRVI